jgi:Ca2+-binding EF-hand superfamily protein
MGFNSIGFISIIMLWSFYLFGVLGVILFRDTDPWPFGTLHMAMFTLFHSATLENWSVVMYINLYGCKKYGYEDDEMQDLCHKNVEPAGFVSVLYFFVFVIISAMVLLTLFIGVVTMAMDQSQQQQEKEEAIDKQIAAIAEAEELEEHEVTIYKDVFRILDLDEGGTIDMEELEMGLEMLGQPRDKEELELMMEIIDEDGTGEINVAEFVNFMAHMKKAAHIDEDDLLKEVENLKNFPKKEEKKKDVKKKEEERKKEEEQPPPAPPLPEEHHHEEEES